MRYRLVGEMSARGSESVHRTSIGGKAICGATVGYLSVACDGVTCADCVELSEPLTQIEAIQALYTIARRLALTSYN